MADSISKSWFAVFNNPQDHGYSGEPSEIVDRLIDEWISGCPTRSCAMTFCVSADGLPHVHMVLEDVKAMRFSVIKKSFAPGAHFEPTKGSKEQAEDYIAKKGKWQEKGEKILYTNRHGEIKGCQGKRRDLEIISELLDQGYTPKQIMNLNISYRLHEDVIKGAYFDRLEKIIPFHRTVNVYYHVGESGSGKSYSAFKLKEHLGDDKVFFVSQYNNGFLDDYMGEGILFLDEFKGSIRFGELLSLLDGYRTRVHSRYHNTLTCWNEVHITSVFPPERLYSRMVENNKDVDTLLQFIRRLNYIVYHWKDGSDYKQFSLPSNRYVDYESLKALVIGRNGFIPADSVRVFD